MPHTRSGSHGDADTGDSGRVMLLSMLRMFVGKQLRPNEKLRRRRGELKVDESKSWQKRSDGRRNGSEIKLSKPVSRKAIMPSGRHCLTEPVALRDLVLSRWNSKRYHGQYIMNHWVRWKTTSRRRLYQSSCLQAWRAMIRRRARTYCGRRSFDFILTNSRGGS